MLEISILIVRHILIRQVSFFINIPESSSDWCSIHLKSLGIYSQAQEEQGVNLKLAEDMILYSLYSCVFTCLFSSPPQWYVNRRGHEETNSHYAGDKDYFHNSRTLPQMWLTQNARAMRHCMA